MKLLLAIDNSRPSAAAVRAVLSRPWPNKSVVRVLSCAPMLLPVGMADAAVGVASYLNISRQNSLQDAKELSESVAIELTLNGLNAHAATREGDPATMIIDEAADWPADLIILGTHGRTGLKELFYGSVAQKVVKYAPCSVEVVKRPLTINTNRGNFIPDAEFEAAEPVTFAA